MQQGFILTAYGKQLIWKLNQLF